MAKETVVILRSDVSGEVIPEGEGETIAFSVGKNAYSIDLSTAEAKEFHDFIKKYTAVATQEVARLPRAERSSAPKSDKAELQAMREWAKTQGMKVSDRGRVSQEIQDAYRASK